MKSNIANLIHTIVSRIHAVVNEVLAFGANLFHVVRGDVVTHVIIPAENRVDNIVTEVKAKL